MIANFWNGEGEKRVSGKASPLNQKAESTLWRVATKPMASGAAALSPHPML
jgi:hypothetical protein